MRRVKGVKHVRQPNNSWGKIEVIGLFHCWGLDFEEFEVGPGNHTVAIVEDAEGHIHKLSPEDIRFLDPSTPSSSKEGS